MSAGAPPPIGISPAGSAPFAAGAPTSATPVNDPAAYWTRLLSDPAFRAMPPDQRAALLTKQVQAAHQQGQAATHDQDTQLGQAVGAVPKAKAGAATEAPPAEEAHPLDAAINDPGSDHQAELMKYVYGP